jgi:type IV secretory pathway VirB4 component
MLNKHFFKTQVLLAALAAALIAPISMIAQQKPAARTIKDSDIFVPERFLEPAYTKKMASDLLKEYIAAFGDSDMPRSYEVFAKDPDKYKRIGSRQLKTALSNLYTFIRDPDLQEVTGATDEWFKKLYNKALELNEPATLMDEAISQRNSKKYTQATNAYKEKFEELNKFVKKGPDRLSADALKKITEANRALRRARYLEQRKQQILEEEAAAKAALEEELKKAKAASKK